MNKFICTTSYSVYLSIENDCSFPPIVPPNTHHISCQRPSVRPDVVYVSMSTDRRGELWGLTLDTVITILQNTVDTYICKDLLKSYSVRACIGRAVVQDGTGARARTRLIRPSHRFAACLSVL